LVENSIFGSKEPINPFFWPSDTSANFFKKNKFRMNNMSSVPNAKKKWPSCAGPNKMSQMGWPNLTCPATLKLFFSFFWKKYFFMFFKINVFFQNYFLFIFISVSFLSFILFREPLLNDNYFFVMHLIFLKGFFVSSIIFLIFYGDELYFWK